MSVKILHGADFHMDSSFEALPEEKAALRRREQLLHCRAEDLLRLCPALRSVAAEENHCIVAGREQLDGCRELLDTIVENLD